MRSLYPGNFVALLGSQAIARSYSEQVTRPAFSRAEHYVDSRVGCAAQWRVGP